MLGSKGLIELIRIEEKKEEICLQQLFLILHFVDRKFVDVDVDVS